MLATGLKNILDKSGPRTELWGTPKFKAAGDEVDSEIVTDWDLSAKYDDSHSRAMPSTPHDLLMRFTNNKWSTVSNAEDKAKRTKKRACLLSTTQRMSLETRVRAVSVLQHPLYANWNGLNK